MRALTAILAIGLLLPGALAFAQAPAAPPVAEDKALAEVLFRDAKALLEAGKAEEACPRFAESHRLDPKPGTILNLASCYETQGKTASAWAAYNEAAAMAARAGQADREDYARQQAAAMEALLSRVKLEVASPPPGLTVTLDERPLSATVLGTAIPIDPGSHTLGASAPGREPWTARIDVPPGTRLLPIQVPGLKVQAPPPPPGPSSTLLPKVQIAPVAESDHGAGRRVAGYVVGGAGLAGIVVGSIFGVRTFSKKSEGDRYCKGTPCTQQGLDLQAEASTSATIATIGFVGGLAAVGAGVALWVTARPPKAPKAGAQLWIAPSLGPGGAGIGAAGTW